MAALIKRVWWYRPNEFTTMFTLTATFADGTTSVYAFQKSGSSWVANGSHDGRLLVVVPDEGSNTFRVRAYENDMFVTLEAIYANETSSVQVKPVKLRRISFPKSEYDNEAPFYQSNAPDIAEMGVWYLFADDDLHDIFITNLTKSIRLPLQKSEYSTGRWQGWGVLNETCTVEHMTPRANVGSFDIMYMPTTEEVLLTYSGFPVVNGDMLTSILSQPCVNNRFVMLPLYAPSGNHIWKRNRTDYREE